MSPDDNSQPPKTMAELGIHFHYLREDVTEIKGWFAKFDENIVPRAEFDKYKDGVTERLDEQDNKISKHSWVQITLTSVATLIVTLLVTYFVAGVIG